VNVKCFEEGNKMNENTLKSIEEEIRKSGHLVSLEASIILNKKGWQVKNAPRYFDSILGSYREVDIVAQRESYFIKNAIDVLVIECKKSEDNPWIFFNQNKINTNVFSLTIDLSEGSKGAIYDLIEKKGIFKRHYYYGKSLSTYYFVLGAKPNSKKSKQIFEAVTQVLNACIFYVNQKAKFLKECKRLKLELPRIRPTFFYPTIVVDGKLYEVKVTKEKEEINEIKHVSLLVERELSEPSLIKLFYEPKYRPLFTKPFIVDIVKLDYFEEFLKNFDKLR